MGMVEVLMRSPMTRAMKQMVPRPKCRRGSSSHFQMMNSMSKMAIHVANREA